MLRGKLIAVHALATGFGVKGVQVHSVFAGNQKKGLLQISPQLVRCSRLAWIIAGDRQAAAEFSAGVLESAHVISLPAMERDGDSGELFQCLVGVHALLGVAFLRQREGPFDVSGQLLHQFESSARSKAEVAQG